MQLYDLKVNHIENPLGFSMERTVFSWKVRDSKGTKQESARVRVALDSDFTNLVFDSGFCKEISSLGYRAEFQLLPYTRYFWDVTVKTDADEETSSDIQWFETAKMDTPWEGQWISCDSKEKRHPYFEKELSVKKEIQSARLYICGLGLYEAYINGQRVGNEYLAPYSNDYKEWVQYQTYDVTEYIEETGKNQISILLGNGWYKARFGFAAWDERGFYGDEWKLIAEFRIVYTDGSEEVIGTDESWDVRRSKITFSNLYDGEHVDMTAEDMPLEKAVSCEAPEGVLMARKSLPVTLHETFKPVKLIRTPKDEWVFDMGQEFTGIFSLKVKEPKGTKIHIQTGEILQEGCFYNENLRSAKSEYIYICDGAETVIVPHFTFFGYRYVKVEGISDLSIDDFTGYAFYSDLSFTGEMETGHDLVNQFISNVRWGLKGNFVDVPTDCPQRDERMGWTGDAQVFSPTAMYLTDSYAFYTKYLYDMAKEQSVLGGRIPDVVPSVGVETTSTVWGDASCIIPWNMYLFYGDQSILEDQYDSMKSWVEYMKKIDGENGEWRNVFHYGDWLALDNTVTGAEQVMGGTDESYIADIYYAQSARIVSKAAEVLGHKEDARIYLELAEKITQRVKDDYFTKSGRCAIDTQTGVILALKHNLSENRELLKAQLKKLFEDTQGKLRTGFVGTPLLNNVLSENGFDELAYGLLLNEEYPGWLREVKLGATTVWERWNSLLDDGTISGIGMNSMNHYSYGSVLEWMFRHVAGINSIDNAPGFTEVEFKPIFNMKLGHVNASYDSPSGQYRLAWKVVDDKHVTVDVQVPFGCKATLKLPNQEDQVLYTGSYHVDCELSESLRETYDLDTPIWKILENEKLAKGLDQWVSFIAVPDQFRLYSLRNLAHKFPEKVAVDRLDELEAFLKDE